MEERTIIGRYKTVVGGLTMHSAPIFETTSYAELVARSNGMVEAYAEIPGNKGVHTLFEAFVDGEFVPVGDGPSVYALAATA